jgi:hypothetical protein
MAIDFRRIRRAVSGLVSLSDYLFDISAFDKGTLLSETSRVSTQLDRGRHNRFQIVVMSMDLPAVADNHQVERDIEILVNLRY